MSLISKIVGTVPYEGQRPGTSGLRKPTKIFMQKNYVANFVQSYLNYMSEQIAQCKHNCLILGGDGRFFSKEALHIIVAICAANSIRHIIIGQNGLFSTPALSNIIRKRRALGGIILTASHNPGGIEHDFGIKFNSANGGPASETVTEAIFKETLSISSFKIIDNLEIDFEKIGIFEHSVFLCDKEAQTDFIIEIVDPVKDYLELMKSIFDFNSIKSLLNGQEGKKTPFRVAVDSMDAVMGIYAKQVFVDELNCSEDLLHHSTPLPDFGGGHPDPNLTYAHRLLDLMKTDSTLDMGCAFDGDGDRNMILGRNGFFVSPCDSVAALADNLSIIPYFKVTGVKGVARSMPTSRALDRVAKIKDLKCFETPTGWKFFGNLMDTDQCSICGEESFGTGSDHIREKDGMWAVLFWLSIVAKRSSDADRVVGIEEVMENFWRVYGRNYFTRYDYENCSSEAGAKVMKILTDFISSPSTKGSQFTASDSTIYTIDIADNFTYTDPVDGSVSKNQGIRVIFTDGSRIVYRLSGTGSSGATIRIYVDSYASDPDKLNLDSQQMLMPLVKIALQICHLEEITGRTEPTVIT